METHEYLECLEDILKTCAAIETEGADSLVDLRAFRHCVALELDYERALSNTPRGNLTREQSHINRHERKPLSKRGQLWKNWICERCRCEGYNGGLPGNISQLVEDVLFVPIDFDENYVLQSAILKDAERRKPLMMSLRVVLKAYYHHNQRTTGKGLRPS